MPLHELKAELAKAVSFVVGAPNTRAVQAAVCDLHTA